jgi:capsular polysaccharide biosynthesis protein
MELRDYLRILMKSWWIIVMLTALAIAVTLIFSYTATPVFESTSSYVVTLQSFDSVGNTLYGLDMITSNQQRVFTTYCRLLDSRAVFDEALKIINVNAASYNPEQYATTCTVLPETNVVRVYVQGPSPAIVQRINEAIGIIGIARAKDLYKYFLLEPIDPVTLNPLPVSPNHAQNAGLGLILGLVLGTVAAFGREYLLTSQVFFLNRSTAKEKTIDIDPKLATAEIAGGQNG